MERRDAPRSRPAAGAALTLASLGKGASHGVHPRPTVWLSSLRVQAARVKPRRCAFDRLCCPPPRLPSDGFHEILETGIGETQTTLRTASAARRRAFRPIGSINATSVTMLVARLGHLTSSRSIAVDSASRTSSFSRAEVST